MAAKVSVIIPVYNAEKYISECIDSLINQTLREIEIICVDDGSTDGTVELLQKYESEDQRITLIQQENQYAGVARNNGINHAAGEYMIFLDADDFFDETMLEKTYNEAKRTEADVVLFGGQIYDDTLKEVKPSPWYLRTQLLPEKLPFCCMDTGGRVLNAITPAPWTKLFRKEFILRNNIRFQPLQNSNDVYFVFTAICMAERISYVDECLVSYRKGIETNLQSKKSQAPLCFLDAYCSVYKALVEKGIYEQVKKGVREIIISGCLYNYDTSNNRSIKEVILEAFLEERFTEMDIFDGSETDYLNYNSCKRLKLLIDAYVWKKKLKKDAAAFGESGQQPGISIVIPVSNEEKSIEACLNSILGQTYEDFEVIFVDEDSQDESFNILYRFQIQDNRIKIYLSGEENAGEARYCGVQHAQGKYVLLLETGNILEKNALGKIYAAAEKNEAEIVLLSGKTFLKEIKEAILLPKSVQKKTFVKNEIFNAEKDSFLLSRFSMELWTKLFRKEFLEKEGLIKPQFLGEDRKSGAEALSAAKRVLAVDNAVVYYKENDRKGQITEDIIQREFQLLYEIYEELNRREVYSTVEKGFQYFVADEIMSVFCKITKYSLKEMFIKELFSERFEKFRIFKEPEKLLEEETPVSENLSENYNCLLGLRKGYLWEQRMEAVNHRQEFELLVNKTYESQPKVSVIVPCYNIEQYVGECLDSLTHQTMNNIEIICINDGSTDGTKEILLECAKRDSRIIVVEQENSGLSVGRNVGVKNASGEYICFVDSDDLLELSALEELYQKAKEENLDVLFCDGESFFETEELSEQYSGYKNYYKRKFDYSDCRSGIELMCKMFHNSEYRPSACLQIIKREHFIENELWFHPGILHEDNPFTFKSLLCAKRAGHMKKSYYLRRVKENSIVTSKTTFSHSYGYFMSFLDMINVAQKIDLPKEQDDVIGSMFQQMLNAARRDFQKTESGEKYIFECLKPAERYLYFELVANAEHQKERIQAMKEEREDYIVQIGNLKKKLQEQKKQITKTKRELKKINKSKAYKVSRFMSRVMGKIKKILQRWRGKWK